MNLESNRNAESNQPTERAHFVCKYERATFGGIAVLVTNDLADALRQRDAEPNEDFTLR